MNREDVLKTLRALPGHIGFCYGDRRGFSLAYNAEEPVVAASVIKLFIMAEAFRRREEGLLDFGGTVLIRREDKMPSCGALAYMRDPVRVTVGDLVTLMIILSDNTAANLLIDTLGPDSVNRMIASMGCSEGTRLRRRLFMPELSAKGIENTVTARDAGLFFEKLLQGTLVSPGASREMLEILKNQRLNGKMPFFLHSRGIACAHKTGEDDGITHDVGIILTEPARIFCFLSERTDVPRAERCLQDLALALSGERPPK